MSVGAWVVVAAVVLALGFGTYRALTDGRFRGTRRLPTVEQDSPAAVEQDSGPAQPTEWDHVRDALPDAQAGERATLLQFSSAFCAPCRATRRVLTEVAEVVPGVAHLEVDAEQHLDLVRRLGVLRTPTTLVLDAEGREVTRAMGAPRKDQVIAALGTV